MSAPTIIRINHDDYHAEYVGHTKDRRQFFLTTPFVPCACEFVALYLFDTEGILLEARVDDLGAREQLDQKRRWDLVQFRLQQLGEFTFSDIAIAPFRVERFGVEFGLIAHAPEEADEEWWVTAEPGNVMAFYPPYDGTYDT